jgi:hypothetical protein
MEYNDEVFKSQYGTVLFFVQRLAYRRGTFEPLQSLTNHRYGEYWVSVCDDHLRLATIAWCQVFGAYKEDLHWTKTPKGNDAEIAKQEFRDRRDKQLLKTGFAPEQWETYHEKMLDFRNKFVAHLDISERFNASIPVFDVALQVAFAYEEWVREVIKPDPFLQSMLDARYEQWRQAALSVVIHSFKP